MWIDRVTEYKCTNMAANILGLGWAATPAGLKAMEALSELEVQRGNIEYQEHRAAEEKKERKIKTVPGRSASVEMCTFLVLNISSLQLIPVNMIAYRSQYGSVNSAGIIAPHCATFSAPYRRLCLQNNEPKKQR